MIEKCTKCGRPVKGNTTIAVDLGGPNSNAPKAARVKYRDLTADFKTGGRLVVPRAPGYPMPDEDAVKMAVAVMEQLLSEIVSETIDRELSVSELLTSLGISNYLIGLVDGARAATS